MYYFDQFNEKRKIWNVDNFVCYSVNDGLFSKDKGRHNTDIGGCIEGFFPKIDNNVGNLDYYMHEKAEEIVDRILNEKFDLLTKHDNERKEDIEKENKYYLSKEDNHIFYEKSRYIPDKITNYMVIKYSLFGYMIGLMDGFIKLAECKNDPRLNEYISWRNKIGIDFKEYTSKITTIDIKSIYDSIVSYPDIENLDYFCYEIYLKPHVNYNLNLSPEGKFKSYYSMGYILSSNCLLTIDNCIELYNDKFNELKEKNQQLEFTN